MPLGITAEGYAEPQTQPVPMRVNPSGKALASDATYSRVIVVSPYSIINVFLESEIPQIIEGAVVDILSQADTKNPPMLM